jgi:hypothetical protein
MMIQQSSKIPKNIIQNIIPVIQNMPKSSKIIMSSISWCQRIPKARFGAAASDRQGRRRFHCGLCGLRKRPQSAAALERGPATHRGERPFFEYSELFFLGIFNGFHIFGETPW